MNLTFEKYGIPFLENANIKILGEIIKYLIFMNYDCYLLLVRFLIIIFNNKINFVKYWFSVFFFIFPDYLEK